MIVIAEEVMAMHVLQRTGRTVMRIVTVFALVSVLCAAANAYTVVMHGGRRIEIPAHFVVTASTLTYEVSPGVQITLEMAAINIPATEKANNEPPGFLMRRAQAAPKESGAGIATRSATTARRTITNRDLESSALRRRNSELAYESRRKQLGLPSVEESRKQAAALSDLITQELQQARAAEADSESYWRARASALRTEIAAVDAELRYVRLQLDESPFSSTYGSFTTVISAVPFGSFGSFGSFGGFGGFGGFGRRGPFPSVSHRPRIFVAPRGGTQLSGRVGFGGTVTREQVFHNPLAFPHSRRFDAPLLAPPNLTVFGSSLQPYDISYERSALITRFNELAATRAGLNARWRELEDEARRAGAPPGWLRP